MFRGQAPGATGQGQELGSDSATKRRVFSRTYGTDGMQDKTFIVRLKSSEIIT
jgi:hypothetical protein